MLKKLTMILIIMLLSLLLMSNAYGSVPSAEEPANKADEEIYRRLPFTFECDFCHINGTAENVMIPHSRTLEYHDKLSLANTSGCFICHDFYRRSKLRLLSGELITFEDSPKLCYQCHQKRYDTWLYGDHGKTKPELELEISTQNTTVEELENRRYRCSDFRCHNPHNPRLFKVPLGIGYPLPTPFSPPEPARFFGESNNEPYYEAVILTGKVFITVLVLVLLIAFVLFLNRNKWRPD